MSTTPPEATPPADPNQAPAQPPSDPQQLPDDHPLVKALAAQKDQIKALKSAQIDPTELKRLRDLDEASKTEAQKQAEEIERLRAENNGYKTREQVSAWKAEVSEATGVPAAVLAGATKEEIEAHAESLKPLIAAPPTPPSGPVVPNEGMTPSGAPIGAQLSEADLTSMTPEQIDQARKEGRLNKLLGIS